MSSRIKFPYRALFIILFIVLAVFACPEVKKVETGIGKDGINISLEKFEPKGRLNEDIDKDTVKVVHRDTLEINDSLKYHRK